MFVLLAFCSSSITAQETKHSTTKTTGMKEFILLVRVPADYSTEQAKAAGPKWDVVTNKWKADGIWVSSFVFPGNSFVLSGSDRQLKNEYVLANNLKVVSTIILKAESFDNAVELAKACPVLDLGGSIEVREVPPR